MRLNVRTGNLGNGPVIVALGFVILYFSLTTTNLFTPVNFINLIGQLAGVCMLAYGVVFVLLIGEIDLSIGFVSGIAGVIVALLQEPSPIGPGVPGWACIIIALLATTAIGAFQGSFVALIGVPSFVVTLAGFLIWQGVIQYSLGSQGPRDRSRTARSTTSTATSSATQAGWIIGIVISVAYVGRHARGRALGPPARDPDPRPASVHPEARPDPGDHAAHGRGTATRACGVPFALLLVVAMLLILTFLAKQTTFGRHVYAVGGNAEAARRAGINVTRIRILVFMISGFMAGLGGIVLASRLQSVDLNAGGGTLLIDAISAAVIGGTSLFGGRGEVRNALVGALLITTIANGMNTVGYSNGVIYIVTGSILLLAVTFDTIARRLQMQVARTP